MIKTLATAALMFGLSLPALSTAVSITFRDPATDAPVTAVPAGFSGPLSLSMNIMGTDTTPTVLPGLRGYQFSLSAGVGVQIDALEAGAPFGQPLDLPTSTGEIWTTQLLSPDGVINPFPSAAFTFSDNQLGIFQFGPTCLGPAGASTANVSACGDLFLDYGIVTISVSAAATPFAPVLTFIDPVSLVIGLDASGAPFPDDLPPIVMLRVVPEPSVAALLGFGLAGLALARRSHRPVSSPDPPAVA